jgi:hypothetical protein
MKQNLPVEYKSLLGGVNAEVAASEIEDDELAMAVNFKPRPPGVVQRGGLRHQFEYLAPNGAPEPVLGLAMQLRNNERGLVVLGQVHASWFRLNYGLEIPMGELGSSTSLVPWAVAAWNDSLFVAREADGLQVLEFGPDQVDAAGHIAPAQLPTAIETAVPGELIAGADYTYVYAFKDSRTGFITNHSPAGEPLTSTGMQVTVANFEAAPSARFDKYVIYRSLPDGESQWLLIAEIDSTETSYLDNIPLEQQGALADEHNDPPVEDAHSVIVFQGRLWIHDGRLVYPSGLLNPEAFPVDEALEVGQVDAEEIVEFAAGRDRILVGKRKSVWSITGTGATSWEIKLVDGEHGVISPRSMFEQNGLFIWASDDDWYASDGQAPGVPLSGTGHKKLRPFFAARNLSQTVLAVPIPGSEGALLGLNSVATISDTEGA